MNREADEIERIAENAAKNAEKIKDAKKEIEGLSFAELNIMDKLLEGGQGGEGIKITNEQLLEFKKEILKEIEEVKEEKKKLSSEGIKEKTEKNEEKRIEKEIAKIKKDIEKIHKQHEKEILEDKNSIGEMHNTMMGMKSNPIGFGKGKVLGVLGKFGVWGVVAQFAVDMVQQVVGEVISEIKGWYGEGGPLDKRKLVLDVLKEYNSINYLTKIKSGGVFFTADAGQDLRQGAPRGAYNTRELRDGHMRFIQLHAGV